MKILLALALILWAASKLDIEKLGRNLSAGDPGLLILGTVVLAIQPLVSAWRWQVILNRLGARFSTRNIVRWTYASIFFNQVLPATIGGDGLRIWLASRHGSDLSRIFNSVLLDRLAMAMALVSLILISAAVHGAMLTPAHLTMLVAFSVSAAIGGLTLLLVADRVSPVLLRWRAGRWMASLSKDSRLLLLNWTAGPLALGLSALSLLNIMLSMCLFLMAFGAHANPLLMLTLLPLVIAASMLPISMGGWGTREVAMVGALATLGVAPETAILSSVWVGLTGILTSVPGAFVKNSRHTSMEPDGPAQAEEVTP
jgi:uncharacterized membrane protein YbhN (UPF0104 family)